MAMCSEATCDRLDYDREQITDACRNQTSQEDKPGGQAGRTSREEKAGGRDGKTSEKDKPGGQVGRTGWWYVR